LIIAAVLALTLFVVWFVMLRMPGRSRTGPLPPMTPAQEALRAELEADVRKLAEEIGERNVRRPKRLDAAAQYVESRLAAAGTVERQEYLVNGVTCANVEVEIAGGARKGEIVVIGGHYDSVDGCPGANDNATGAAAVLALARRFAGARPARTLRFVAFVNEEPPFFRMDAMGSAVYAKRCAARGENVVAMLSLETLGCYRDEEGSQRYPVSLLKAAYPSRGDFVTFVGNVASRALVRDAIGAFRASAAFPSEGAALPSWLPGVDWSDHSSFWDHGFPAAMVTDTAPFRYAQYHTADDTVDRVDFQRLARVVDGVAAVVARLADPEE
jgi:Zn-dependent M28 family amino/carboxypeptidase